jgi:hypothetical protein
MKPQLGFDPGSSYGFERLEGPIPRPRPPVRVWWYVIWALVAIAIINVLAIAGGI